MDDEDGNAVMKFSHDNEIKRSDLLALDNFRQLDDELINTQVGFRINSLKQKTKLIRTRLIELTNIIQSNNPNLNEHIVRVLDCMALEDDGMQNT